MKTLKKLFPVVALAVLSQVAIPHVVSAQAPVAPGPPAYFPTSPFPGNGQPYPGYGAPPGGPYSGGSPYPGVQSPYPGNRYPGTGGPNGGQGQQNQLPDGVDSLIANQGTNTIIALATQAGYERVRQLVKYLDGNLDVIRTDIKQVPLSAENIKSLGITASPDGQALSDADTAKVLDALKSGRLAAGDTARLLTRETTAVDVLLKGRTRTGITTQTPLTLVPRENSDGSLALEIIQPKHILCEVGTGGSAILPTAGPTDGGVTLVVLTPSILPSSARAGVR